MVSFVEMKTDSSGQADSEKSTPEMHNVEMDNDDDDDESDLRLDHDDQDSSPLDASQRLKRQQQQQQRARYIITPTSIGAGDLSPDPATDQARSTQQPLNTCTSFDPDSDDPDEEQLKRILSCKRLSEGNCNRHLVNLNICRKNSLHMIGESLPPVTEGEPMRHMSLHMGQNIDGSQSSSTSSASLRGNVRHLASKRNSQDDNTTSCSSSTSLDGSAGPRSPSRRRSSTVSQCSSVLSEGTRQQLNFDLSPDLPPDSSILEANTISPTEFDRPASPEPCSLDSADGSFDMRPISRMSQFCDDIMTDAALESPDSTLGDSTSAANQTDDSVAQHLLTSALYRQQRAVEDNERSLQRAVSLSRTLARLDHDDAPDYQQQQQQQQQDEEEEASRETNATSEKSAGGREQQDQRALQLIDQRSHEANITDNLERIISHVSEVKVSSNSPADQLDRRLVTPGDIQCGQQQQQQRQDCEDLLSSMAGQKRAHTPFGANIQRNKATHIEFKG